MHDLKHERAPRDGAHHHDANHSPSHHHHGRSPLPGHPQVSERDLARRMAQRQARTDRTRDAAEFRRAMKQFAREHIPGRVDKMRVIVKQAIEDVAQGKRYDVDKYGTATLERVLDQVVSVALGMAVDAAGGMMVKALARVADLGAVVPTKLEAELALEAGAAETAVATGASVKANFGAKDPFSAALNLNDKAVGVVDRLPRSGKVELADLMNRLFDDVKVVTDTYAELVCAAIDSNVDEDFAATTWRAMAQTVAMAGGGELQPTAAFVETWMMSQLLGVPADMVDTVADAKRAARIVVVELRLAEAAGTAWGPGALATATEGTRLADDAVDHAVVTTHEKMALERDKENRRRMSLAIPKSPVGRTEEP